MLFWSYAPTDFLLGSVPRRLGFQNRRTSCGRSEGSFPWCSRVFKKNLELIRQFAESYPNGIYETAVSQMPWGHNIVLMQRLNSYKFIEHLPREFKGKLQTIAEIEAELIGELKAKKTRKK